MRALPSDKPGALPPENGFPLKSVRVRGQTGPHTQHKRDGAPLRNGTTVWPNLEKYATTLNKHKNPSCRPAATEF
jgi:hypothetical protein